MKENTKFLWMYVGILFSFALILIIFAGLSTNNDAKQTKGLKSDITELSQEVTELKNINLSLQTQVDNLTAEKDELVARINSENAIDEALLDASKEIDVGEDEKAMEILKSIDLSGLTPAQSFIYNGLVSEME